MPFDDNQRQNASSSPENSSGVQKCHIAALSQNQHHRRDIEPTMDVLTADMKETPLIGFRT
jgi:hypothetical protein